MREFSMVTVFTKINNQLKLIFTGKFHFYQLVIIRQKCGYVVSQCIGISNFVFSKLVHSFTGSIGNLKSVIKRGNVFRVYN